MKEKFIRPCSVSYDFLFTWVFGNLKKSANPQFFKIPKSLKLSSALKILLKIAQMSLRRSHHHLVRQLLKCFGLSQVSTVSCTHLVTFRRLSWQ